MRFAKAQFEKVTLSTVLAFLLTFSLAGSLLQARAQAIPATTFGLAPGQVAPLEIGFGYAYFHANAPPSGCGCFSLNGGAASMTFNAIHGISFVADLSGANANQINGTAENIGIFDYLFGVRYSRRQRRYTPYVQGLAGASAEFSNTASYQNKNAFAAAGGLGLNTTLSRHWGWNVIEADYIYSRLPNGVNSYQSDFRATSRLLFRFGPR